MRSPFNRYLVFTAILALCFAKPLFELLRQALRHDLFSHALLVLVISGCLIWMRRNRLAGAVGGVRWPGVVLGLAGLGLLAESSRDAGLGLATPVDSLAAQILSFCLLVWGGGFLFVGSRMMRAVAFPALFLLFAVPLPTGLVDVLERALQHASAETAFSFIKLTGTPVYREGLVFQFPGIAIAVGKECSGIRSSLVLFITALLVGHLFLHRAWTRLLLAAVVVPLGIVRNAFRILVISMLTVHVDSSYIHSPLHRQGGPVFFLLSLIPFSLILFCLVRIEMWADRSRSKSRGEQRPDVCEERTDSR